MPSPQEIKCSLAGICSGCSWIKESPEVQARRKVKALQEGLFSIFDEIPDVIYERPFEQAFRDRLDFTIEDGRRGLYSSTQKKIVDLEECPLLSPPLAQLYAAFRKIDFPIKKGSFRLRVGPQGQRGIWLDFANEDIKNLLEFPKILTDLLSLGFIEIGQKGKTLNLGDGKLKLKDPEYKTWFETRFQGKNFPLFSLVSHFTQPGHSLNQSLLDLIDQIFDKQKKYSLAAEFGSGIGNLTFPFLEYAGKIVACDWSGTALHALKRTLFEHAELKDRIEIREGDFIRQTVSLNQHPELLILNPARSGVGNFLSLLPDEKTPSKSVKVPEIFYMSCYLESFLKDALALKEKMYQPRKLIIFDQFPHTPHFEILSLWSQD
jgi:23S rRNA (uracil1939-C5)-methyltransferase